MITSNYKKIKIDLCGKEIIIKKLNINCILNVLRNQLINIVSFPFIFLDKDDNEIETIMEGKIKLKDILDGKNLHIKKKNFI